MDQSTHSHRQVDTVLEVWRSQALNAVVWILLVLTFPVVLLAVIGWPVSISSSVLAAGIMLYLVMGGIALCRHADVRWRGWAFLLASYALSGMQLWRAGMAGSGRITLLTIPLYAMLLLGFRSGWVAIVLDVLHYGAFIGLLAWGLLTPAMEVRENPVDLGYWVFQGVLLLAAVVPLAVLFNRLALRYIKALDDERRLEEEIAEASEKEQRRLASELHDGLCQHLTVALLQCAAMENQQTSEQLDRSALCRLRTLIEESMGMAHDIAKGLWPLDFGVDALGSALERLAKRARETTGVNCELLEEGDTAITDQQAALHLYRIAQEAVANAIRHAGPHNIHLTLCGTRSDITLCVEDDGCGMPEPRSQADGLGLRIMANRADLLGGKLDLEQISGGGTRVICRVPRNPLNSGGTPADAVLLKSASFDISDQ